MKILESYSSPDFYWDQFGDFVIPCESRQKMPTISILFGGYWMEMAPEDWIIETDGQCWACLGESDD